MNYADLVARIQDITEDDIATSVVDTLIKNAELRILSSVELPVLRTNSTASVTSGNQYLTLPGDFLYPYSLSVEKSNGEHKFLLNKDVNFIREAYPNPATTGLPKHYALFDEDSVIMGPTPDDNYDVELHYSYFPDSIVDAGTTWLGDEYDTVLLDGALVEAARFLKFEQDLVQQYESLYLQSLKLLVKAGNGDMRRDTYRSGQARM